MQFPIQFETEIFLNQCLNLVKILLEMAMLF